MNSTVSHHTSLSLPYVCPVLLAKLKKNNAMMTDFHDFIGTTERSQEKIEESVMTLLHVVNKESDILFRKKKQVAAETL